MARGRTPSNATKRRGSRARPSGWRASMRSRIVFRAPRPAEPERSPTNPTDCGNRPSTFEIPATRDTAGADPRSNSVEPDQTASRRTGSDAVAAGGTRERDAAADQPPGTEQASAHPGLDEPAFRSAPLPARRFAAPGAVPPGDGDRRSPGGGAARTVPRAAGRRAGRVPEDRECDSGTRHHLEATQAIIRVSARGYSPSVRNGTGPASAPECWRRRPLWGTAGRIASARFGQSADARTLARTHLQPRRHVA